jgi:Raf kinase inhibitor-like YbhB/YbcL family protein
MTGRPRRTSMRRAWSFRAGPLRAGSPLTGLRQTRQRRSRQRGGAGPRAAASRSAAPPHTARGRVPRNLPEPLLKALLRRLLRPLPGALLKPRPGPLALLAGCALAGGCGFVGEPGGVQANVTDSITVSSPLFRDGHTIPTKFTCRGAGQSPPLRWSGAPPETRAFAVIMDDLDAPSGGYVHWVVFNIDATTAEIVEGPPPPQFSRQAQNTARRVGYTPPCPPPDDQEAHRYRFTVYALRQPVSLQNGAKLGDALSAIARQVIARGRLTGNFGGQ